MKIVKNRILPFGNFAGINLFGVLFVREGVKVGEVLLRHEAIHTRQMLELGIVPFYLCYVIEWLVRLPMRGDAYRNISFEREAYANDHDSHYLARRRHYAWVKYLRKKQHTTIKK